MTPSARQLGSQGTRYALERVLIRVVAEPECPVIVPPAGKHRAVVRADHRVSPAARDLRCARAAAGKLHMLWHELVAAHFAAESEAPVCVVATREQRARVRKD